MGFVTGVDDRALERRLESDDLFEEFGARTELEERITFESRFGLGADLAGADDDLARDEVRHHGANDVIELDAATYQIVLVGAVGVALAVGVVLVERDRLVRFDHLVGDRQGPSHHLFARDVIERRLERGATLRRGVLGVRVIDVETRAVGEDGIGEVRLDDGGEGGQVR